MELDEKVERKQRAHRREGVGTFVGPGPHAVVDEGFMAVDLSKGGMSVLRLAQDRAGKSRGLDAAHGWIDIPLPAAGRHVSAMVECVHRRRVGPLETLGVKFLYMAPEDRAFFDAYMDGR